MTARSTRLVRTGHEGRALLLRVVPYRDADAVVTMLTDVSGVVGAIAHGARRMKRASTLVLEPMHTLQVAFDERGSGELATLREARLATTRLRLTGRLEALDAAGRALRWVRDLAPARQPEPALWAEVEGLLDRLDAPETGGANARGLLASSGLRLLQALGYGLELGACTRCGRPCPERSAAFLDATAGGLVCTACGGAASRVGAELRRRAVATIEGDAAAFEADEAEQVLGWVDAAVAAHLGRAGARGA